MWCKNGALSVKTENRSVNVRLSGKHTDIVRKVARRKVIRPINDDVVVPHDLHGVLTAKQAIVQVDPHVRINGFYTVFRGIQLLPSDVVGSMQNLALQIRKIDDVEIDKT